MLDQLLRPDIVWVLIPLTALFIPIAAIAMEPVKARQKIAERREIRAAYERLMQEKLDIIKTAVAMGYRSDELAELDQRLEQLIGAAKMRELLEGKSPRRVELLARELGEGIGELARAVKVSVKD